MNKNKKLIPELRFPVFKKDEEWEEVEFGILKLDVSDGNYSSKYPSQSDFLKSGVPFIRSNNLKNGSVVDEDMRFISEKQHSEITKGHLKEGDILLSTRGELGTVALVPKKHVGSNINAQLVRINTSNILVNTFLFYVFELCRLNKIFDSLSTGTALKQLPIGKLNQLKLLLPKNKSEQLKIASCLSSLDELIVAHRQKLDLLKDHKKGLMQNLFPQEGETLPTCRFKYFEQDGEWVEKTIDTIKSILTDYVANGSFQSLRENLIVVDSVDYSFYVRLTDLRAGLGHSNQKYVNESTYKFLNKSALFGGELLMANIGANVGEVWQMPDVNKPATLAPNMIMIKFKPEIDSEFVYQYLRSDIGVGNISTVISGSGHPKISKTDLRQVKVTLPPRIEEQQKIASCLSSLDTLITAQAEKIEQLKWHKKGLMQGLFPKIND